MPLRSDQLASSMAATTEAVKPTDALDGTLASPDAMGAGRKGRSGKQKSSQFVKDETLGKTSRLAQVLMARLSYANLKVNQGWIKQNIDEVEHLYSSRFSVQAEQRRSLRRAATTTTTRSAIGSGLAGGDSTGNRALLPPLDEGSSPSFTVQQLLSQPQIGTSANSQNSPPRRPFADDIDDGTLKTETKPLSSHYLGYTPTFYAGYDEATGISYPGQAPPPRHQLQPHIFVETDSTEKTAGTHVPHHQANHSMYSYLASPVAPSSGQFASPSQNPNTGASSKAAVQSASAALHAQQHSWSNPGSLAQVNLVNSQPIATSTYVLDAEYHRDGQRSSDLQSPAGPHHISTQDTLRQYPIAPAPAITPRPDLSAPTFTSVVTAAKPSRKIQHPHSRADYARGHQRNPSLRGEYSVSNVTMDDLDSHFGQ
ncbi:hypothetical protein P389DRAFT_64632 [Cystobasidium minutum MCA 4210]|uniref:uncharacterized protein n=1 Tax=Cystobasidium minutum MCA 4210 TaxID=1397322 RepID=UPI0034CFA165|eukprot:jgi/Rhomi1/64632/CE64631_2152